MGIFDKSNYIVNTGTEDGNLREAIVPPRPVLAAASAFSLPAMPASWYHADFFSSFH